MPAALQPEPVNGSARACREPPSPKTILTEDSQSVKEFDDPHDDALSVKDANASNGSAFPRFAGRPIFNDSPENGLPPPFQKNFSFDDRQGNNVALQLLSNRSNVLDESMVGEVPRTGARAPTPPPLNGQPDVLKRKAQYFNKAFAYREPINSAREIVTRDSVIIADFKTNVIIDDEYTIVTDLSCYLSARYHRPESSIVVNIAHSGCLLLGGSFDPAYILTITALPSQVQPATNKRNAILIQAFMAESLGVSCARGVVKFLSIPEGNLASHGRTVLGEIELLEKKAVDENLVRKQPAPSPTKSPHKKKRSLLNLRARANTLPDHARSTPSSPDGSPPVPPIPTDKSALDQKAEKIQKLSRRRSFLALFGR
ncbi:MAG: hypothetical protein M1833_002078 [Piccolia ochrophora]|nr:MAG: hypothetical protein M1833_002078 [Piccolia ochrophora]